MTRRWPSLIAKALVVLALVGTAAVYWLLYDNRMPSSGSFPLDIAAIRAEANRLPGDKPGAIQIETVTHTMQPQIALVAGASWTKKDYVRTSYRVIFPTQNILIDTTHANAGPMANQADIYDDAAWKRVVAAMDSATRIVVTHEHGDHMGGLMAHPRLSAILPKALLTPVQFDESGPVKPLSWPKGSRVGYTPFSYDKMVAIAPGVVLIKTPGHTPGSQMIYVQRADGQEYLFMGDTASDADNVRLQRIRSRLVTDFMTRDDRAIVMRQVQALGALAKAEPRLAMIPGHDGPAIAAFEKQGLFSRGFVGWDQRSNATNDKPAKPR